MPRKFWSESVLTATYLINRMPIASFDWQSPYERLFEKTPDYTHIKMFGYFCYDTKVSSHKDKFDPRSIRVVIIGYAGIHKAYKSYDL